MRKLNKHTPSLNWREIPLVRLLIPFIVGIYLGETVVFFQQELLLVIVGLFIGLSWVSRTSFDFKDRWKTGVIIYLFFLVVGYCSTIQHDERSNPKHFKNFIDKENTVIGKIANYPSYKGQFIKIELETEGIRSKDSTFVKCTGTALLYLKKIDTSTVIHYGDRLIFKGTLQLVAPPKNPAAFDYQAYLHFQNIHYQSFVEATNWKVLSNQQAPFIFQIAYALQRRFTQTLADYLENPASFAIAAAMTLGYKSAMTEDVKTAYSESGAIHVLAVSGLHVGIISEVLLLILGFFANRQSYWKYIKWLLCLGFIWSFVLLVGATNSVVRAALMFSFLNFARILRRDIHPFNSLAAAAFCILVYDPYALFQVGFQFSFLAVVGIFLFYKNIYKFWIPANAYLNFFWQLTVLGISAQLMVTPLSMYYFHQLPMYSLLSGLFVVPFAMIILYMSLSLLLFSWSPILATYIGIGLSFIIEFQNKLIFLIQQLPFHLVDGIWLQPYEVAYLYISLIGVAFVFFTKRLYWLQWSLVFLIILVSIRLTNLPFKWKQEQLVIYAIPNATLIDWVYGRTLYTWTPDSISQQTIDFNTQNFRWSKGLLAQEVIPQQTRMFETPTIFKKDGYLQVGKKRIIILNKETNFDFIPKQPLSCEYLLVRNNSPIDISKLQTFYQFDLLIFDQSNTRQHIKEWKRSCERKQITYYDIGEEGAFISYW